ncbi:SAM-dependent DNA methyltransferase [Candidatus Kaiserbacteria bacterium]|nr:SAM-dependent DNA methyltransferase [Candidatus Kaiserbacteria bacterium]
MTSSLHTEVTAYLLSNTESDFGSLESALLATILNSRNIIRIKNREIKEILEVNTPHRKKALEWLHSNIAKPTIQHLLTLYELRVSSDGRKLDGAYYTPQIIVDAIVDLTLGKNVGTVCDPACGSGAFLLGAVKKLQKNGAGTVPEIISKYIWGVDIDSSNVIYTKRVLILFAILEGFDSYSFEVGIFQGNSLIFNWSKTNRRRAGFDFIVGNPPYVRGKNLTAKLKYQIRSWPSAAAGIADLYIPFFEIGLSWVHNDGRVGYITPNTYFSSINGRKVREMIFARRVLEKVIDLNGFPAFEGLLTYTCVTILDKSGVANPLVGVAKHRSELEDIRRIKLSPIEYSELEKHDWYIQPKHLASEMRIMETVGTPLHEYVPRFTTGIATLRNDLYIFKAPAVDGYITVEKDGKTFQIEEEITVSIIKPNRIKTEAQLAQNQERILYPYKISEHNKKPSLILESEFQDRFPGAYSYLKHFKSELEKRSSDPGASWYAFGRSQALDGFGEKIIFPMMSDRPVFLHVKNPNTLIYCGYALYPQSKEKTIILLKVLNSPIFWNYLSNTSKNYSGGYKSMAKNYVKKFSIPDFSKDEISLLASLKETDLIEFLKDKYNQQGTITAPLKQLAFA